MLLSYYNKKCIHASFHTQQVKDMGLSPSWFQFFQLKHVLREKRMHLCIFHYNTKWLYLKDSDLANLYKDHNLHNLYFTIIKIKHKVT